MVRLSRCRTPSQAGKASGRQTLAPAIQKGAASSQLSGRDIKDSCFLSRRDAEKLTKSSNADPFGRDGLNLSEAELKKAKKLDADGVPRGEVYNAILAEGKKQPGGALDSKVHKFDVSKSPADGPATAVATLVVFSDFQ